MHPRRVFRDPRASQEPAAPKPAEEAKAALVPEVRVWELQKNRKFHVAGQRGWVRRRVDVHIQELKM